MCLICCFMPLHLYADRKITFFREALVPLLLHCSFHNAPIANVPIHLYLCHSHPTFSCPSNVSALSLIKDLQNTHFPLSSPSDLMLSSSTLISVLSTFSSLNLTLCQDQGHSPPAFNLRKLFLQIKDDPGCVRQEKSVVWMSECIGSRINF